MELGLSLGDSSSLKPFVDVIKTHADHSFHMGLSLHPSSGDDIHTDDHSLQDNIKDKSTSPPLLTLKEDNGSLEGGSLKNVREARELDVNRVVLAAEEVSSTNRTPRLFHLDSGMYRGNVENKRRLDDHAVEEERGSKCRASDDDEKGSSRKKLKLSKQQSAFLEQSFEEHSTLNPKQKHALAEQLNMRPRQVEVWFQNRRARTKLKQTEVDCECLKRCFETLTEENRKLHKQLQELRAFQTSTPFYMQSPATTLTMCSSCHNPVAASYSAINYRHYHRS